MDMEIEVARNEFGGFADLPKAPATIFNIDDEEDEQEEQNDLAQNRRKDKHTNKLTRVGIRYVRFKAPQKTEEELFDEDAEIQAGPGFDDLNGADFEHLIEITGGDGSRPEFISSFVELLPVLRENSEKKNIHSPTLIQKCVIPILVKYRKFDLIARAETGSGKTAAYLFPIIHLLEGGRLSQKIKRQTDCSVLAIILSPTRELAQQLGEAARVYTKGTSLRVVTTYGEVRVTDTIDAILDGCDILVSTLGRLMQFVKEGLISLSRLRFLVLDEADKLLQNQFLMEVCELKKLVQEQQARKFKCQMLMFSATFSQSIEQMAKELLRPNYFRVTVNGRDSMASTIKQKFLRVTKYNRVDILVSLLTATEEDSKKVKMSVDANGLYWKRVPKTLVFCNTRRITNWLALKLSLKGIKAIPTNGDRTQQQRLDARSDFERGDCDVLVSTNVTARGLNLVGISQIVNFELPKEYDDYVHRIGRTGRAGNAGEAISFVNLDNPMESRLVGNLVEHLERIGQEIPDFLRSAAFNMLNGRLEI